MEVELLEDLPLLGSQLEALGFWSLLDKHFPDHGLWGGISGGKVAQGWLLYILSESDHRLSHVEDWASLRLRSLQGILGERELRALDFSDDRLGRLLDRYSDDKAWHSFEEAIGKSLLKVYSLEQCEQSQRVESQRVESQRVESQRAAASEHAEASERDNQGDVDSAEGSMLSIRSDSFNAPQFRDEGELFRHGYSKHRRSDQPQCKVMMAALDPMALPLAVEVVKGSGTDADHYMPLINRVRDTLSHCGHLYIGDSQLGSISNRSAIHQGKEGDGKQGDGKQGDYYLCPLNRKQCSDELRSSYLELIPDVIESLPGIFLENELENQSVKSKSSRKPAYYFELKVPQSHEGLQWEERRVLVYSPEYAQGLQKSFDNRLTEAQEAMEKLVIPRTGRRNPKTLQDLHMRIDRIIQKYKVKHCFEIQTSAEVRQRLIHKHKNRPERTVEETTLHLQIHRNEDFIVQKRKSLGWQIYASNVPENKLDTRALVLAYRDEFRIEHLFDYIINRDVGLLPLYLKKEARVKALIRLLSLAMKFSVMIQYQARKQLAQTKTKLKGIYPGNKGRATDKPTTPMLMRAFKGLAAVWIQIEGKYTLQVSELNQTQKEILALLNLSEVYNQYYQLLKLMPDLRET